MKFVVLVEDGYYIDSVVLDAGNGYPDELTEDSDGYYTISEIYDASKLTVTVLKKETRHITYVGATEENHVNLSASLLPSTFTTGEETSFKIIPESGYGIDKLEFSDESIMPPIDYSDFTLLLPNDDITITITTVAAVGLKYKANSHIHDVEFYADLDYATDYKSATVKNKITSFVPSERNQFFVTCRVDDGYKVKSLSGLDLESSVSGSEESVKTPDGKSIFRTYLTQEDTIVFNLVKSHVVSLDKSVENVELSFEDDKTSHFEGDTVRFNIIVNGNYKVSTVSASYLDDGTVKDHEINPTTYGDFSYRFNMPDSEVTIKVELVAVSKIALSYTNTAGNLIQSIRVYGTESKMTLDKETTSSGEFETGEQVKITVLAGNDHSKKVKASFVPQDGSEATPIDLSLSANNGQYDAYFTLPKAGTIAFEEGEANEKRTVTLSEGTSVDYYTSKDPSSKTATLGDLYDMDVFYFAVKNKASDGKRLVVSLTIDGEKEELSETTLNDGTSVYKVTVTGNVKISAEEVESVSFTINDLSDYFGSNEEDEVFLDPETDEPIEIVDGAVTKGTKFYVSSRSEFEVTKITIGGKTATPVEDDILGEYYVCTADVVVTIDFAY